MQSALSWQSWRTRFLPYADSIVGPTIRYHGTTAAQLRACQRIYLRRSSRVAGTQESRRTIPPGERVERFLRHGTEELYPRTENSEKTCTVYEFRRENHSLEENESAEDTEYIVSGRISSTRSAGSKLFFFDINQGGYTVQVLCNYGKLLDRNAMDKALFKDKCNDLSRGDVISVRGYAHRTERGELSIKAVDIPKLLSPCLQPFPIQEFDRPEKDKQALLDADRHVQLLSTKNVMETIRCRSTIIRSLRNFLSRRSFIEVDTPILGAVASGATARPFETKATEFLDRRLALRIAPELWLKRLILGGFEKVFEIGPSFRNEGLDKTHNPEFTTCEFYTTHTSLNDLMSMTEALLHYIHLQVSQEHTSSLATTLPVLSKDQFSGSFPRLPFIPTLENALGLYLPPLHSPDTLSTENALKQIFHQKSLPLPQLPTIPRLLDKLSAIYLEPRCIDRPTFITHHPECLSPLSKSYLDPITHQKLSARAELFINGREIANMYEEENSPFEQKKKFDMQNTFTARAKQLVAADQSKSSALDQDETLESDTSYLEALEWGLPPTGGWGCGVDRLVMLFTGKEKISDVLTFGNLRSVTRVKGGR